MCCLTLLVPLKDENNFKRRLFLFKISDERSRPFDMGRCAENLLFANEYAACMYVVSTDGG